MQSVYLTVEGIGPFQKKKSYLDFTDDRNQPCNIYVLVSENGRGKTNLLDLMACLVELLSGGNRDKLGFENLNTRKGRAQCALLGGALSGGTKAALRVLPRCQFWRPLVPGRLGQRATCYPWDIRPGALRISNT